MRPATKAFGSRTAPEPQETVPHATALAPAAQPRPAPPGRALPAVHAVEGVTFARRLAVGNSAAPFAAHWFSTRGQKSGRSGEVAKSLLWSTPEDLCCSWSRSCNGPP